jgi:hypothetical protein
MGDIIQVHLTLGYLKSYDIRISQGSLNHPVKFTIILNANTLKIADQLQTTSSFACGRVQLLSGLHCTVALLWSLVSGMVRSGSCPELHFSVCG